MAITKGSFSGQVELRQDVHGGGGADIDELSPHDRVSTILHLTDTINQNGRHARVHAQEALKQLHGIKNPRISTLKHNLEHAMNHVDEMVEHGGKLAKHVGKYPGAKAMEAELQQAAPSRKPGKPKVGQG